MPEFVFANRAGLEMFETTSGSLQDLAWDKTLDEDGLKLSYATFTQVLQQVRLAPYSKPSWFCDFALVLGSPEIDFFRCIFKMDTCQNIDFEIADQGGLWSTVELELNALIWITWCNL